MFKVNKDTEETTYEDRYAELMDRFDFPTWSFLRSELNYKLVEKYRLQGKMREYEEYLQVCKGLEDVEGYSEY